jgi:hypothetical protein
LVDDFCDASEFKKDVEAEGDLFIGKTCGFDDATVSGEIGPSKVLSLDDAKLEVVGREKFIRGRKSDGAVASLGAWDDLFDTGKAFEPGLKNGADGSIGVCFRKYGNIPARDHERRLSKDPLVLKRKWRL